MTQHMTDSRFHMWRTLVALVHIDHQITEEERSFFLDRLHSLSFTEEQENTIKNEMGDAQDVTPLFEKVTDKEDRATLIYFARLLFWSDGEFVMQEEKILESLRAGVIDKLDLEKIMSDVDTQVAQTMQQYDDERAEESPKFTLKSGLMYALGLGFWPARAIKDLLDD